MRTRIWHSDWKPRWLIRCVSAALLSFMDKQEEICGHDRVYLMAFACQARRHNPCREKSWPRYPVCFAGELDGEVFGAETVLGRLTRTRLAFGLHIFDRNFKVTEYDSRYRFPDRYQSAIKGSLDYEHMLTAYRCYDVMMNVNTVTDSLRCSLGGYSKA